MKALIFDKELKFIDNFPTPSPLPGEALIRIKVAGICNTDIEITKGYMGFKGIPGHEFVGIVEKINNNDQSLLGKRVVGEINCACKKTECEYCQKGLGRHCPNRTTLGISGRNGCFGEYITLPIENLLEVPDNIPDNIAVLTEPLAAGFEILEQVMISEKDEVLIVGDGKLGLLINHALSTTGAKITHVGKHADKLELVKANRGQTFMLDDMPKKQFDIVIEATGSISGFNFSMSHTKPRGTLVLKSTIASSQKIDMTPVVVNEITIVGSRCGLFKPALDYLSSGVDLNPLIQAIYPIDNGLEGFEKAKIKGSLKVLIVF
ncbi:MAG: alcohol dehydrogenase catalytic domain-containing protein [Prolixibacteraceae bacterium]|nr:alcohol dehydrogenase catalytic domain-containing protein [Prolixibacteraceae bacterium]